MDRLLRVFTAGSFAALTVAWGALGGAVGVLLFILTQEKAPPLWVIAVCLYIAMFVAFRNAQSEAEGLRSQVTELRGPDIQFDEVRYAPQIWLAPGQAPVEIWQLWWKNLSGSTVTIRNLTAQVVFRDPAGADLTFTGQWIESPEPDHAAWTIRRPWCDLPPTHHRAKLLLIAENDTEVVGNDGSVERFAYGLSGENLFSRPATADHEGFLIPPACTHVTVSLIAENMSEHQFEFQLHRNADGSILEITLISPA